ncbi:MAG TPA: hypothetical protein VFC25_06260 [Verrucomicrobiae bacterium]|nr:hypothetical protein [Verrucomicrobiae bacterium]
MLMGMISNLAERLNRLELWLPDEVIDAWAQAAEAEEEQCAVKFPDLHELRRERSMKHQLPMDTDPAEAVQQGARLRYLEQWQRESLASKKKWNMELERRWDRAADLTRHYFIDLYETLGAEMDRLAASVPECEDVPQAVPSRVADCAKLAIGIRELLGTDPINRSTEERRNRPRKWGMLLSYVRPKLRQSVASRCRLAFDFPEQIPHLRARVIRSEALEVAYLDAPELMPKVAALAGKHRAVPRLLDLAGEWGRDLLEMAGAGA